VPYNVLMGDIKPYSLTRVTFHWTECLVLHSCLRRVPVHQP